MFNTLLVSTLFYAKAGLMLAPGGGSLAPAVGIGGRYQDGPHGMDFSLNAASSIFTNYASIKGLYLHHPYPENRNQFYWGIGGGIGVLGYYPMGPMLFGNTRAREGWLGNLEGVVGYEYRIRPHLKTFLQLELTQPLLTFGTSWHRPSHVPGIAFTAGIGF